MNKQQEINDLLAKFRKKCGIENDCGDLAGNLKAELQEAIDATDKAHKAEEFADIYIIAANAVEQLGVKSDSGEELVSPINMNRVTGFINLDIQQLRIALIDKKEFDIPNCIHRFSYYLECIRDSSKLAIQFLGYNPESVILEKCKLINTRTGKMNEAGTKWCKDKSQDPATLYKMDIEGCLL